MSDVNRIRIAVYCECAGIGEDVEAGISQWAGSEATTMRLTPFSAGGQELWMTVIQVAGSVSVNLFASWLYDAIKEKAHSVEIEPTITEMSEGEITRVIHEKLRMK